MPKLFEWLGLAFFFYSEEHEPIHVHVTTVDRETIFELIIDNGIVKEIRKRSNGDRPMLNNTEEKLALKLIRKYKYGIIERWVKYFVWHKPIKSKKISSKTLP
jgi:Domain of unknown function (DUF4160)